MEYKDFNIGDEVYVILKFGSYRDGFDIQIAKYEIGWKGEKSFIPTDFRHIHEKYQVINYGNCFKNVEEAKKRITDAYEKLFDIEFVERYNGDYYNVFLTEKKDEKSMEEK